MGGAQGEPIPLGRTPDLGSCDLLHPAVDVPVTCLPHLPGRSRTGRQRNPPGCQRSAAVGAPSGWPHSNHCIVGSAVLISKEINGLISGRSGACAAVNLLPCWSSFREKWLGGRF